EGCPTGSTLRRRPGGGAERNGNSHRAGLYAFDQLLRGRIADGDGRQQETHRSDNLVAVIEYRSGNTAQPVAPHFDLVVVVVAHCLADLLLEELGVEAGRIRIVQAPRRLLQALLRL